ncbi:DUF2510 domain-containing protein [Streptacidiphilus monticola]
MTVQSTPEHDRPAPGYYPDPSIPGFVRYWDGDGWTPAARAALRPRVRCWPRPRTPGRRASERSGPRRRARSSSTRRGRPPCGRHASTFRPPRSRGACRPGRRWRGSPASRPARPARAGPSRAAGWLSRLTSRQPPARPTGRARPGWRSRRATGRTPPSSPARRPPGPRREPDPGPPRRRRVAT